DPALHDQPRRPRRTRGRVRPDHRTSHRGTCVGCGVRWGGGVTVTVVRRPEKDRYGDRTGEPVETELPGAVVAPRSSSDTNERGRDGAVVGLALYAPPGSE